MTTYVIEYFDNTELSDYLKNKELIKFKGFKKYIFLLHILTFIITHSLKKN